MSRELSLSLTQPQAAFALADDRFPAVVAGYGSGKTEALVNRLLIRKVSFPSGWVGYYAPSYDLVSKIAMPRLEELLTTHGLPYKLNKVEKMMHVKNHGAFIFRTMENPASIVGFEHADAGVDELDTLKEAHAEEAWKKIIARNRQRKDNGEKNTVAVATTPEGFRFTYREWYRGNTDPKKGKLGPKPGYKLYKATTFSNLHNLPDDYIETLQESYSSELLQAYLMGEFVNLTSGSVYGDFDRDLNGCEDTINAGESVHIGLDFNVHNMAAVAFVIRNRCPIAIGEITKQRDTPAMIEAIKTKYGNGRSISVYPDASGQNTSSKSASVSDIILLRNAGFNVQALSQNPPVKDRVASVSSLILNAAGQRRLKVNISLCPSFAEALEQQVYDTAGAPDKKAGLDHVTDAGGYFMYRQWPVGRNANAVLNINGF